MTPIIEIKKATRPTKKELLEYVGKNVRIVFWDNEIRMGKLNYYDKVNMSNLSELPKWFALNDTYLFKVSHIKKVEEIM